MIAFGGRLLCALLAAVDQLTLSVDEDLAGVPFPAGIGAHRGGVGQTSGRITNVDLLQQTLRGAVRRAIEDPSFAALFASDAMILGQWPLTSR